MAKTLAGSVYDWCRRHPTQVVCAIFVAALMIAFSCVPKLEAAPVEGELAGLRVEGTSCEGSATYSDVVVRWDRDPNDVYPGDTVKTAWGTIDSVTLKFNAGATNLKTVADSQHRRLPCPEVGGRQHYKVVANVLRPGRAMSPDANVYFVLVKPRPIPDPGPVLNLRLTGLPMPANINVVGWRFSQHAPMQLELAYACEPSNLLSWSNRVAIKCPSVADSLVKETLALCVALEAVDRDTNARLLISTRTRELTPECAGSGMYFASMYPDRWRPDITFNDERNPLIIQSVAWVPRDGVPWDSLADSTVWARLRADEDHVLGVHRFTVTGIQYNGTLGPAPIWARA